VTPVTNVLTYILRTHVYNVRYIRRYCTMRNIGFEMLTELRVFSTPDYEKGGLSCLIHIYCMYVL
jgi:hypothetical protein